jgi:hypothetical protein
MMRTLVGIGLVAVILASGLVAAEDQPRAKDTKGTGTADNANAQYMTGKIVRIDQDKGVIVVSGANNREQELRVGDTTKFYGTDRQALTDGLKYKGFREGTPIWWRMGTGDNARSVSDLRFYNPGGTGTGTDTPKQRNP